MDKLPVLFRINGGEVTAVFPTLAYSSDVALMMCYAHVGQHSAAHVDWIRETRPATANEAAPLLAELRGIYDDCELVPRQRMSPKDREARLAQINAWREEERLNRELVEFRNGYLEALAFTDMSDVDDEARDCELSADAQHQANVDCVTFLKDARELLDLAYEEPDYSPAQAGRDFWFTRNGHGVGFWDRPQLQGRSNDAEDVHEDTLGDKLSAIASRFRSLDVYRGDDGKAYLA